MISVYRITTRVHETHTNLFACKKLYQKKIYRENDFLACELFCDIRVINKALVKK